MSDERPADDAALTLLAERVAQHTPQAPEDQCWNWTGMTGRHGYGLLSLKGKSRRAHRIALMLREPPPSEQHVACHSCDNTRCVNPAHLWWGTRAENSRDMVAKGRGRSPFPTRLTPDDVRTIRRLSDEGMTLAAIAARYGVRATTIGRVVKREAWKNVA